MPWTKSGWNKKAERAKKHLQPGEEVLYWTAGVCESTLMGHATKRNGIILATRIRVVIVIEKMFGFELEEYPYHTLSSIENSKGLLGYSLTLIASANRTKITMMAQGEPAALIDHIRAQIGKKAPASPGEVTSQLERLATLMQAGALTEAEYQQAKQKLLT